MIQNRRSTVILVSGQPGAGKSTLARAIADAAGIPHLNRDTIYGGYRFTHGLRLHPQDCWEALLSTTQLLAKADISLVLDLTTYIGEMEDDIRHEILPFADLTIVFCQAADAYERYTRRIASDGRDDPPARANKPARLTFVTPKS